MSAPIPTDIESGEQWQVRYEGMSGSESGEQWQVRYEGMSGSEVVRTGNRGQVLYLARQRREFGAVVERRTITVGAWEAVDIDAPLVEPEADDEA